MPLKLGASYHSVRRSKYQGVMPVRLLYITLSASLYHALTRRSISSLSGLNR
ncbi:hypothetical protein D3C72_1347120 [compost metagenome]